MHSCIHICYLLFLRSKSLRPAIFKRRGIRLHFWQWKCQRIYEHVLKPLQFPFSNHWLVCTDPTLALCLLLPIFQDTYVFLHTTLPRTSCFMALGRGSQWKALEGHTREEGASQVVLVERTHLPVQETEEMWIQPLGREDTLEEGMATHSSVLAWRIPWTEETGWPATVHGVAQSQTQLKRLSTARHKGGGQDGYLSSFCFRQSLAVDVPPQLFQFSLEVPSPCALIPKEPVLQLPKFFLSHSPRVAELFL